MKNSAWNSLESEFLYYASLINREQEIMDALKLITASKSAIDGIKLLNGYAEEIKDVQKRGEFMRIIGQLSIELAETQMRLAEQIQNSINDKQNIKDLEAQINSLQNPGIEPIVKDGLYYKENNDGPFCTGCYDSKKQFIRLTLVMPEFKVFGKYSCPICKSKY